MLCCGTEGLDKWENPYNNYKCCGYGPEWGGWLDNDCGPPRICILPGIQCAIQYGCDEDKRKEIVNAILLVVLRGLETI
jgi:hypothetical protein